jgi:hypothetical protein
VADDGDLLQCIQHLDDDIQLAFRTRFRGINTGLVARIIPSLRLDARSY